MHALFMSHGKKDGLALLLWIVNWECSYTLTWVYILIVFVPDELFMFIHHKSGEQCLNGYFGELPVQLDEWEVLIVQELVILLLFGKVLRGLAKSPTLKSHFYKTFTGLSAKLDQISMDKVQCGSMT